MLTLSAVHRDLKPENVLFKTPDHHSPIVIADFGIAKYLEYLPDDQSVPTSTSTPTLGSASSTLAKPPAPGLDEDDIGGLGKGEGGVDSVAGSFGYAAPEVLAGKRHGVKVDCWSIG